MQWREREDMKKEEISLSLFPHPLSLHFLSPSPFSHSLSISFPFYPLLSISSPFSLSISFPFYPLLSISSSFSHSLSIFSEAASQLPSTCAGLGAGLSSLYTHQFHKQIVVKVVPYKDGATCSLFYILSNDRW